MGILISPKGRGKPLEITPLSLLKNKESPVKVNAFPYRLTGREKKWINQKGVGRRGSPEKGKVRLAHYPCQAGALGRGLQPPYNIKKFTASKHTISLGVRKNTRIRNKPLGTLRVLTWPRHSPIKENSVETPPKAKKTRLLEKNLPWVSRKRKPRETYGQRPGCKARYGKK